MGNVYEFNPRTYVKSNMAHTAVILVPTEEGGQGQESPQKPVQLEQGTLFQTKWRAKMDT